MKELKISVNDSHLKVCQSGDLDARPVIIIHGLTGNHFQLQFYREALKDKYRVLEVDVRGRGESGSGENPSSISQHKDDIVRLIDHLELEEPILIGYSMGGYIASLVASEVKTKALVLLDSAAEVVEYQDKIVVPTFGRISKRWDSKEEYVNTVVSNYSNMQVPDSKELRTAVEYEVEEREDGFYNKSEESTIREDWASMRDFDVHKVFENIDVPVLLVQCLGSVGEVGPLFAPEHYVETKKAIKDLSIYESDTNHYTLVFDKQEDINNKVRSFLENLD